MRDASLPLSNTAFTISISMKVYSSGRAYIVPREPSERSEAFVKEIIEWFQSKVANHKRLRGGCIIIDAIPKS